MKLRVGSSSPQARAFGAIFRRAKKFIAVGDPSSNLKKPVLDIIEILVNFERNSEKNIMQVKLLLIDSEMYLS